jgi:hypothetical protein
MSTVTSSDLRKPLFDVCKICLYSEITIIINRLLIIFVNSVAPEFAEK